uniref:Sas10 C-terminal domain-containing protein n=1 Tax=Timema monikensis TaxID=170555 RepID=A0A7R9E3P2_9NEOP|nr:unnamed protein product [Timema monikensis]
MDEYVPSDSEDEYSENEKILLEKTRKGRSRNIIDSEEEVFGLNDSDDDDGGKKGDVVADSDLDAQEDGDDLPNVRAWGQSKRDFYHTDYVDQDYGGFDGKDAVAAEYEEQEARAIQQRLAEQLDEGDFSLDIFTKVIKTDLSKLSKRQKLALLQKEAPEFSSLVQDFKDKMTELQERLAPVLNLIKEGKIPTSPAGNFVKTKYHLILNYCTNISFYLLLKTRRISVQSHPVVRRLYQYRQLLKQLEPVDQEVMTSQIDTILKLEMLLKDEGDEKRAITYKMAKNRGLTPYRKKELRNPRVKHRIKYRKAKIRRKGQVREPRYEIQRYGGEISGIKTSVTRSTKIK